MYDIHMIKRLLSVLELAAEDPGTISAKFQGAAARPYALLRRPWARALGIRTVLDVGAHEGRWAKACRLALPEVTICSFEPIPACNAVLRARMRGDAKHRVYPFALGRTLGELRLQLHAYSASSSLLSATDEFKKLNQGDRTVSEFLVPVMTLDSLKDSESWEGPILLKLDVQGYELEVVKGSVTLLPNIASIVAETSFRPLYHGQVVFGAFHDYLAGFGFRYFGSAGTVLQLSNKLEIQQDSVFINERFFPQIGW
jgi:FkbM family methyltransferase